MFHVKHLKLYSLTFVDSLLYKPVFFHVKHSGLLIKTSAKNGSGGIAAESGLYKQLRGQILPAELFRSVKDNRADLTQIRPVEYNGTGG